MRSSERELSVPAVPLLVPESTSRNPVPIGMGRSHTLTLARSSSSGSFSTSANMARMMLTRLRCHVSDSSFSRRTPATESVIVTG